MLMDGAAIPESEFGAKIRFSLNYFIFDSYEFVGFSDHEHLLSFMISAHYFYK